MQTTYTESPRWLRILALICSLLMLMSFCVPFLSWLDPEHTETDTSPATEPTTESTTEETETTVTWEEIQIPELPVFKATDELVTVSDVTTEINKCNDTIEQFDQLLNETDPKHPQYNELLNIRETVVAKLEEYQLVLDTHWNNCAEQKPVMTYVWTKLIDAGFSEPVVAGIVGNMIAETGGQGYGDLRPTAWDSSTGCSFYGLCQWSSYYYPSVANTDVDFQIQFLLDTYEKEFNNYGSNYSSRYGSKFRTEQFIQMTDPYEAAIAFAKCYERCAAQHVEFRGTLGNRAYEYFTMLNTWPWPSPNPYEVE